MDIGFTGTQDGMTTEQCLRVRQLLEMIKDNNAIIRFRHGDCIGADAQAHRIARSLGFYIIGHPPIKRIKRAFMDCDELKTPRDYLLRNRDIVDFSHLVIAAPKEQKMIVRSGTWSTVRYAKTQHNLWVVVKPAPITDLKAS